MTVAAVIIAASAGSALAEIEGQALVRRLTDIAWSGGAVPVVVVAPDPDGEVSAVLLGAPAMLVVPSPAEVGAAAGIARGLEAARQAVTETTAGIAWPADHVWVDPETLTSLIEGHGADPDVSLRPTYRGEPGWPVLLPLAPWSLLARIGAERNREEILADLAAAGLGSERRGPGDRLTIRRREAAPADRGAAPGGRRGGPA